MDVRRALLTFLLLDAVPLVGIALYAIAPHGVAPVARRPGAPATAR